MNEKSTPSDLELSKIHCIQPLLTEPETRCVIFCSILQFNCILIALIKLIQADTNQIGFLLFFFFYKNCTSIFIQNIKCHKPCSIALGLGRESGLLLPIANIHSYCALFLRQHGGPSERSLLNPVAGTVAGICSKIGTFLPSERLG